VAETGRPFPQDDMERGVRAAEEIAAPEAEGTSNANEKADKQRKKEEKFVEDARRPLDAWERYRALLDALDEGHQLVELADRKARFALVIMGALNVAAFLLAARVEVIALIPDAYRSWLGLYVLVYAFVAVYFFLQAIEALRPRSLQAQLEYPGMAGPDHFPMGLRYYEDAVLRDVEAHRRAWREVKLGQLNAELAVQTHALARINVDKYAALRRLYVGLRVMTLLAAGLMTFLAVTALAHSGQQTAAKLHSGKPKRGGLDILGTPERLATSGVREPSGVAFDLRTRHLFVVGDEGRLAELDTTGQVRGHRAVKGNLEDVAVHPRSGSLFLLSEKKSELVFYDPTTSAERTRWRLDDAALLGEEPRAKNQGFEGLAFHEQPSRPGGGLLYLVHQRSPAMVVVVAFDPEDTAGPLAAEVVVDRWRLEGHEDLTAATWVPSLGRLLVVADARDRILVVREDGSVEAEVVLPGLQQEGLSMDDGGTLWVADDRGGLLRFAGALPALTASLPDRMAH